MAGMFGERVDVEKHILPRIHRADRETMLVHIYLELRAQQMQSHRLVQPCKREINVGVLFQPFQDQRSLARTARASQIDVVIVVFPIPEARIVGHIERVQPLEQVRPLYLHAVLLTINYQDDKISFSTLYNKSQGFSRDTGKFALSKLYKNISCNLTIQRASIVQK